MAEVPINQTDLENVVVQVTRDYLEYQAIEGRIENVTEGINDMAIKDVSFIINSYMTHFNDLINKNTLSTAETFKTNLE